MKIEINRAMLESYALGYYDGRAFGEIQTPRYENEQCNLFYKQGYDSGVADFCTFDIQD